MAELEVAVGYRFADPALLQEALTHRSVSGPGDVGYDRLEFLGDRVLGLVIAELVLAAAAHQPVLLAEGAVGPGLQCGCGR